MAFEGNIQCIPGAKAGEAFDVKVDQGDGELRNGQYLFVRPDGEGATWVRGSMHAGGSAWVIQNVPKSGEAASIAYSGVTKVRVGAPEIVEGALVCVGHEGRAVNVHDTGDFVGGLALTGGVEGDLISILLMPGWYNVGGGN
jgi:hypothetical protein